MDKYCLVCNKKIKGSKNWLKRAKYCSHSCAAKKTKNGFKNGSLNPEWIGGKPSCKDCGKEVWWGVTRCRSCASSGKNSSVWKGDKVSYSALHTWVRNCLGSPKVCNKCGTTTAKRYDWSNISYGYKREVDDWERLCRSCHIRKDKVYGLGKGKERKLMHDIVREVEKYFVHSGQ